MTRLRELIAHPEGNPLMWPRQLVGYWIVSLGKKIENLGDWIGGWEVNAYAMGMRIGIRLERERAERQAWKAARKDLPREW